MATYVAITTINSQTNGWNVLATGSDKGNVFDTAVEEIQKQAGTGWDIYDDTKRKNLRVVSKTKAKRFFGVDIDVVECDL